MKSIIIMILLPFLKHLLVQDILLARWDFLIPVYR